MLPEPLAGLRGPTSKRREGRGREMKGEEGNGRGEKEKGRERTEGKERGRKGSGHPRLLPGLTPMVQDIHSKNNSRYHFKIKVTASSLQR